MEHRSVISLQHEHQRINHKEEMQPLSMQLMRLLDSKKNNSVLYVSFGSSSWFSAAQLNEIAKGLEASGQDFIWVVRKVNTENKEEWLPEGFEERMEGKGLIKGMGTSMTQLIVGEEANDIRNGASALKEMAKRAAEEGGSSHSDLKDLLDGLRLNSSQGDQSGIC
ncbi:hypothetical protein CRYUN_Cryun18bG0096000 [Craigia yunnanensis]